MQYLTIAKIINTHGIKGEVKVLCNHYGNNYRNWKVNETIYLENNGNYEALIINTIRLHKNWLLVSFKNYNDINAVLFMKNKSLVINDEMINVDNLWFHQDLTGYQAINIEDKKVLGKIIRLVDNNHSGIWEVVDQDNKSHYLPNDKFFINKVDKLNKIVYVNLISGMFDYE